MSYILKIRMSFFRQTECLLVISSFINCDIWEKIIFLAHIRILFESFISKTTRKEIIFRGSCYPTYIPKYWKVHRLECSKSYSIFPFLSSGYSHFLIFGDPHVKSPGLDFYNWDTISFFLFFWGPFIYLSIFNFFID